MHAFPLRPFPLTHLISIIQERFIRRLRNRRVGVFPNLISGLLSHTQLPSEIRARFDPLRHADERQDHFILDAVFSA